MDTASLAAEPWCQPRCDIFSVLTEVDSFPLTRTYLDPGRCNLRPSVEQMRKAGVLKSEKMSKLGGDEDAPKLELPVRVIRYWDKLRKTRAAVSKPLGRQPSNADCTTTLSTFNRTVITWVNSGEENPKSRTLIATRYSKNGKNKGHRAGFYHVM